MAKQNYIWFGLVWFERPSNGTHRPRRHPSRHLRAAPSGWRSSWPPPQAQNNKRARKEKPRGPTPAKANTHPHTQPRCSRATQRRKRTYFITTRWPYFYDPLPKHISAQSWVMIFYFLTFWDQILSLQTFPAGKIYSCSWRIRIRPRKY